MEGSKDVGGFESGPPPVSGLGNYKGVMLCTRPMAEAGPPLHGDEKPPFRPPPDMMASEPLGLPPPIGRKLPPRDQVKTRGPSAALRRHVQWLKELQTQVKEDQRKFEDEEIKSDERKQRMQQVFKQKRDAVRAMKHEGIVPTRKDLEAILAPSLKRKTGPGAATAPAQLQKPLWAMTAPEKDDFEEKEAGDLIDFVDGLDFEKYIGDLEFRQCLGVLRDRASRLKKEQDSFKEAVLRDLNADADAEEEDEEAVESASQVADLAASGPPVRRRMRGGADAGDAEDRPDWDASTVCSDERPVIGRPELRAAAGHLLEAAPHLRGVHSKESMQKLIERTQAAEAVA